MSRTAMRAGSIGSVTQPVTKGRKQIENPLNRTRSKALPSIRLALRISGELVLPGRIRVVVVALGWPANRHAR